MSKEIDNKIVQYQASYPDSVVTEKEKEVALAEAVRSGEVAAPFFRGFQYMIYRLSDKFAVSTEDSLQLGFDVLKQREDFFIDGVAGRSTMLQIRFVLDRVDPTGECSRIFDDELKRIGKGERIVEGALYDYVSQLYRRAFHIPPVLFLPESAFNESYVVMDEVLRVMEKE